MRRHDDRTVAGVGPPAWYEAVGVGPPTWYEAAGIDTDDSAAVRFRS